MFHLTILYGNHILELRVIHSKREMKEKYPWNEKDDEWGVLYLVILVKSTKKENWETHEKKRKSTWFTQFTWECWWYDSFLFYFFWWIGWWNCFFFLGQTHFVRGRKWILQKKNKLLKLRKKRKMVAITLFTKIICVFILFSRSLLFFGKEKNILVYNIAFLYTPEKNRALATRVILST